MAPVMRDKDKYVPGEEREDPPIGLYKIVKIGGGTPKIKFDDPYGEGKKAPRAEEEAAGNEAGQPPENSEQAAEEKEIEFLRAERAVLEEMIKAAAGPLWEDEDEPEEDDEEKEHRKPSAR